MNDHEAKDKARLIEGIKKVPAFLDAVFLLHHSTTGVLLRGPAISPEEVFETFNKEVFAECLRRSQALMSRSVEIGMAAHGYNGTRLPHDQAVALLKEMHPGFSDDSYGKVVARGMFEMR